MQFIERKTNVKRKNLRKKSVSSIIFLSFSVFVFQQLFISCSSAKKARDELQARKVSTVTAKKETKENNISSFGTITYKTKHDVSATPNGTIARIFVKEGDFVKKGQKLAVLKNVQLEIQKEQYENALESAKASLKVAQSALREEKLAVESKLLNLEKQTISVLQQENEYENSFQLHQKNAQLHEIGGITDVAFKNEEISLQALKNQIEIAKKEIEISSLGLRDSDIIAAGFQIPHDSESKKELLIKLNTQSVQAQVDSANANVNNAEKSLQSINRLIDELIVKAEVSGIIGVKNFEEGEYVSENTAIFTILNTSDVFAVFTIQEKDIEQYCAGTQVSIEIPSINKKYDSKISEVSPIADFQSGNFTVKAIINNPDNSMKPGMFVKSTILEKNSQKFLVLPESALIKSAENEKENKVFIVSNGHAVLQKIEIDSIESNKLWILSGISEEMEIIDNPPPFLKEGEYVVTK